jgi:UDP-N-acetylmuramoyl-tripeptide--D-alanyl-D-alanine ligase
MKAALENFHNYDASDKVVILGDMFELGVDSSIEHQKIVELAESFHFTQILLVGENFNNSRTNNSIRFKSFEDLKEYMQATLPLINTKILIKGSRGMALERCLELIN